jgi:hypothetical protein
MEEERSPEKLQICTTVKHHIAEKGTDMGTSTITFCHELVSSSTAGCMSKLYSLLFHTEQGKLLTKARICEETCKQETHEYEKRNVLICREAECC